MLLILALIQNMISVHVVLTVKDCHLAFTKVNSIPGGKSFKSDFVVTRM